MSGNVKIRELSRVDRVGWYALRKRMNGNWKVKRVSDLEEMKDYKLKYDRYVYLANLDVSYENDLFYDD